MSLFDEQQQQQQQQQQQYSGIKKVQLPLLSVNIVIRESNFFHRENIEDMLSKNILEN
jgi:hypothetical protein